jgi:prophage tail gpP-like protein
MILKIDDRIRNRKVEFFNNFSLQLKYDSVASTFSFSFLYNPDNQEHVELGVIGHYHIGRLEHNGQLLVTGYILSNVFKDTEKKNLANFSGYSLPGVLEDSSIPVDLYPLQFDGLSLKEIAEKLVSKFDFNIVIDSSVRARMNQVFDVSTANEKQSIKQYLAELASQKNIILSHDEKGNLLFTQAKANQQPILNFDGGIPFTSMTLKFNGQPMHSHITVMKQASSEGGNAGQSTIRNPYVPFVFRPKTIIQSSGDDNDTSETAKMVLASELKNFKLTIVTDRWEIDGDIIKPNNIISVTNAEISLFKKTEWFIESVTLTGDEKKTVATLKCVLPEVYNGQTPKYIFEGINLH